jgi:hypothetical protein
MTRYEAEHDGARFTRTTNRTYTHVVVGIPTDEHHQARIASMIKYAECRTAAIGTRNPWDVGTQEELDARRREAAAGAYAWVEENPEPAWEALAWCGRQDLADAKVRSEAKRTARSRVYREILAIPVSPA